MMEAEQKAEEEARRVRKLAEEAQATLRNAPEQVYIWVLLRVGSCSLNITSHSQVYFLLRYLRTKPLVGKCVKKGGRRKQW